MTYAFTDCAQIDEQQEWQEPTVTLEVTQGELQDLRLAMMDYRSKWFDLYIKALDGEMPQNFSTEGAGLILEDVKLLQHRLKVLSNML